MITLELSRQNWNTRYLKYNPENWIVSFDAYKDTLTIRGFGIRENDGGKISYGPFDSISIRHSEIPEYCRKDVKIWD